MGEYVIISVVGAFVGFFNVCALVGSFVYPNGVGVILVVGIVDGFTEVTLDGISMT